MTDWNRISNPEVQMFIIKNELADEREFVLQHKTLFDLPAKLIAEQFAGKRKAKKKLPLWYNTSGIVYPPSLNLEQSSSLATAMFKAEFLKQETQQSMLVDLTGGFGVDSFFFSKEFESVAYVEPDANLIEMVQHNHAQLGAGNIKYHNTTAENFISTAEQTGVFYLDPARRDSHAKKVFKLADCAPDVTQLHPQLFTKSEWVFLKASPLLDIQQGLRELPFVKTVLVVAVDNEVKEVLFLANKGFVGLPEIVAIDLDSEGKIGIRLSFTQAQEATAESTFGEPQRYLYEPAAALLKAGAFKLIGQQFELNKLSANTHLYTSTDLVSGFPGRTFEIQTLNPTEKELRELPGRAVNIVARNYPLKPEAIKKKLKLTDGGNYFMIGFSTRKKKHLALCRLINAE